MLLLYYVASILLRNLKPFQTYVSTEYSIKGTSTGQDAETHMRVVFAR